MSDKALAKINKAIADAFYFQDEVCEILGVSRQHVKQAMRDELQPVYLRGFRTPLYDREHIHAVLAKRNEKIVAGDSRYNTPQ